MDPKDNDELDGCEVDFTIDPDDEETEALRHLFPDGVAHAEWEGLFDVS